MPQGIGPTKIERFPLPSGVIDELPEGSKKTILQRLFPEYGDLCSFAHANLFKMMFNKNSKFRGMWNEAESKDTFQRQVAERTYTTSLISIVQARVRIDTDTAVHTIRDRHRSRRR